LRREPLLLADLRVGQAWALQGLGVVQRLTGDYPAATASLTRAPELFRDLGDRHGQSGASINLGELLSLSLAYREARGYFVQALSIARDIDTPAGEGRGAIDLQQALAIYRRIGAPETQCVRAPSSSSYDHRGQQGGPMATAIEQASPDSPRPKTEARVPNPDFWSTHYDAATTFTGIIERLAGGPLQGA
jgi:tetratricopeptide (TPR) repeat protein